MKFKDLKAKFEHEVMGPVVEQKDMPENQFRAWLLIFLFEIYGNLDSIAVSLRDLTKLSEVNLPDLVNKVEECGEEFRRVADLTEKRMKS